jgi:adenylate cyclase
MSTARRHGILIGLTAALLSSLLWFTGVLEGWENTTWTWRVATLARPGEHTEEIRLILLDQAALDWGQEENGLPWPWPREVYGPILDFCARAEARVVAFDVLFTEPSAYGVPDDEALGAAIERQGAFVGARFLKVQPGELAASGVTEPVGEIGGAAGMLANVSDLPDPDGVFRRAGLVREWEGELVPSLGVATWQLANDNAGITLDGGRLRLGDRTAPVTIPVAGDGTALLRFRGRAEVFPTFGAAAIIQSELRLLEGAEPPVDPEEFRDAYVLFGFSAPGLLDLRPTPLNSVSPGVLVHATVLDNLLGDDFMREAGGFAALLGILLLGLLAGLTATAVHGMRASLLAALLFVTAPLALGFAAYECGWWWPVLPGTVAVALAFFGGMVRNYAVEGRQRRFIKSAFRHYLSPAVIERILDDPNALELGGERRELTILFSDLQGFTSLSEQLDPLELTALLNDYLTEMTDIILEEGGTLDKYEGDAIMAFWNAPLLQPDHAARACRAAVRCQQRLAALRDDYLARAGRELIARIGVHTGEVVVGNMGSKQRFDYTVLGDAANLASRLEGANKAYDSRTMVSEATRVSAGDAVRSRPLGSLQVVGRKAAVEVHELIDLGGAAVSESTTRFTAAIEHCRAGELAEAQALFEGLPRDPVAARYAARCREAIETGEAFRGHWNLTSK